MVTEMFQSVLILTTATVYVVFADITIECPQCTHISADLDDDSWIPLAAINTIRNEACVAYPFDPTADGISLVQCTAAVNQVAKCVSFDGLVNTDLSILGIVAMNTHIKYCAVVDIDPGNVCEHTEGDENSGTDLSQQITQAMSILNFLGDDSFSGRLCYSDGFRQPDYKTITCPQCGHITTDATSIPSALLALFQNEACVAVPFDASAEGIDEVQCTPMGNQVAKCVSFDGEVDASLIVFKEF
uniref:Uncharacterized protein LOC100372592 n=1 Tax=Saccoglossus kowalevskii TaxID=10224 RepID=A0ABM0GYX6_SACKO|nr:PREDICTED: uncharacterized protein LOC100372592 [Saccoglossus kowalevskii]